MIKKKFSFIRRQEFDERLAEAHAEIARLRDELMEQRKQSIRAAELLDLVEEALMHQPTAGASE